MAGVGDLLHLFSYGMRTPLGPFLTTLLGAEQQKDAEKEAREKTEARYDDALSRLQRTYEQILGPGGAMQGLSEGSASMLDQMRNELMASGNANMADIMGGIRANNASLMSGYRNRTAETLADLEGLGTQARQDLNRSFDISGRNAVNDLRNRGLGSSSLVAGAYGGNERERSDALGRLEEQLRRERLGYRSDLTGQMLGAQERGFGTEASANERLRGGLLNMNAALRNAIFSNYTGNRQMGMDLQRTLGGDIVNLMAMRNDIPPQINPLLQAAQAIGQSGAGKPDQPSWWDMNGGQVTSAAIPVVASTVASMFSDRDMKHDFAPVDHEAVTAAVRDMPITEWSYKNQTDRHIGPMAQDFRLAFGLGKDDKTIFPTDEAGVLMVAVQHLIQRVDKLEERLSESEG